MLPLYTSFRRFLFWILSFCLLFIFSVHAIDRIQTSSWNFIVRSALGQHSDSEKFLLREADALAYYASEQTGIYQLRFLRFNLSDQLYLFGAEARFNPFVYRVSLSTRSTQLNAYQQRWNILHEIGHAVAISTLRWGPIAPKNDPLSYAARKTIDSSLVYEQAYAEAFAEIFASSFSYRLDHNDPHRKQEHLYADQFALRSTDLTHDNVFALRLAQEHQHDLSLLNHESLLRLIDTLASISAHYQISAWSAHAHAYCSSGVNKIASWVASNGHMSYTNPFDTVNLTQALKHQPIVQELSSYLSAPYERTEALKSQWVSYQHTQHLLHSLGVSAPVLFAQNHSNIPIDSTDSLTSLHPIITQPLSWGSYLALFEAHYRQPWRLTTFYLLWNTLGRIDSERFDACRLWAQQQIKHLP